MTPWAVKVCKLVKVKTFDNKNSTITIVKRLDLKYLLHLQFLTKTTLIILTSLLMNYNNNEKFQFITL